jgi:hypothetical protein
MQSKDREALLKIGAGAAIGLFLLNSLVIDPFFASWKKQSERTTEFRDKVQHGRQLLDREKSLRDRWAEMLRTDLADDSPTAEGAVAKAIDRWVRDSRVSLTNMTQEWRKHDEGYDTFECRATATGDQASLARLLYEIETDPLPARVEESEISARDAKGKELSLSVRFSFVRITGIAKNGR